MAKDDEAARLARARALRKRIAALKSGQTRLEVSENDTKTPNRGSDQKPGDDTTPLDESPREFVRRRMRELDRDKRKDE
jgi:hypothetical protein